MQNGLKKIPLSRVFAIEKVQESKYKLLVNVLLGYIRLEIWRFQET